MAEEKSLEDLQSLAEINDHHGAQMIELFLDPGVGAYILTGEDDALELFNTNSLARPLTTDEAALVTHIKDPEEKQIKGVLGLAYPSEITEITLQSLLDEVIYQAWSCPDVTNLVKLPLIHYYQDKVRMEKINIGLPTSGLDCAKTDFKKLFAPLFATWKK